MADESIWKKELSFKRKPKEQKQEEPAARDESAPPAESTSI